MKRSGARTQADDYRAESQRARDCRDLPQGIPQRPHPLRLGEGLCGRQPGALLQRHQEQRLGLRHHVARPVRQDTAVAGVAAAHPAGGAGLGGGKPRSAASSRARTCHGPCSGGWRKGKSTFRRSSKRWNTPSSHARTTWWTSSRWASTTSLSMRATSSRT